MAAINPAEQPTGEADAFGFHQSWRAELVAAEQMAVMFDGGERGDWRVGLYRVTVAVREAAGSTIRYEVLKTGRRKA